MELADAAAKRLVDGLVVAGYFAAKEAAPARLQVGEHARHLFLFVILSVLLEKREGKDAADALVAEKIKESFSLQLIGSRKALKAISKKALKSAEAAELERKLDQAAKNDPFAPYYDSFGKMTTNPDHGPFGILARKLSDDFFAQDASAAYEKIFLLAATLSDELISRL